MEIGILTNVVCNVSLREALAYFRSLGITMVEIGCGGTPGIHHCNPEILLHDEEKFQAFQSDIEESGLKISAFSCHGNPVHPTKDIAARYDGIIRNAILMAEKMNVDTICCFSGCPGDHDGAKYPNWVTGVWPFDYVAILDYQWNQRLIPYWSETARFAKEHGVNKIALEMHPGFAVYNPKTLLRLREACGDVIGANFDPSHLIWQGIDCATAIQNLKGCIYHFHAKDTQINEAAMNKNGFFSPTGVFGDADNSFHFRIPGNGTDSTLWKKMITALGEIDYDGVISIEHEDNSRSQDEGVRKTVEFLSSIIIKETRTNCWWKESIRQYQRTFLPEPNRGKEGVTQ